MLDQREQIRREAKLTCGHLRDEAVDGEAAAVDSSLQESADEKIDTVTWVSRQSGLPLRQESDIDVGGSAGKSHRSSRYEYRNVQPPAGMK